MSKHYLSFELSSPMFRIECKYFFKLVIHIWQGYLTFSCYFILGRIVCVLVTLPMTTICDAYQFWTYLT